MFLRILECGQGRRDRFWQYGRSRILPAVVEFEDGEREPRRRPPGCPLEDRTVTEAVSPRDHQKGAESYYYHDCHSMRSISDF